MNLENICEGLIVKNYKEMCELLEETIKAGNSKISQIKEWERYFKYHKDGNKFVIDEIYEDVAYHNPNETRILFNINKGRYSKEVFPLVKSFVGKHKFEHCSKNKIMSHLNLKNNNYDLAYKYPKKMALYLSQKYNMNITIDDVNFIASSIYENANDKINNAFENLQKLGYISDYTNKLLMIYNKESKYTSVVTNQYLDTMNDCILSAKKKVLLDYYVKNKSIEDYYDLIDTIEKEFPDNIEGYLSMKIFIFGLYKGMKLIALDKFKEEAIRGIDNFFYAYGYIKNDDIEWDKEILDIAKEKVHLQNYKNEVKDSFLMESFLEKWFKEEFNYTSKDSKKLMFMTNFKKYKQTYRDKVELLFDIFTSKDIEYKIDECILLNTKEIKDDDVLPF